MEIVIITFIIAILLCLFVESSAPLLFWFLVVTFVCIFQIIDPVEKEGIHTYKVRELEKNTTFTITDTIGGYKPLDTAWVNMSKRMIDPADSVAMMVVIVEEIK